MLNEKGYRSVADYFYEVFRCKVQKIAVDAGLSCPNRDGSKGTKGCSFCNNNAFIPRYCNGTASIQRQLSDGMRFFSGRAQVHLAYFQSYSNTYGDTARLIELYESALSFPGIAGIVAATRPDCLQEDLLDYFAGRFSSNDRSKPFLMIELGAESTLDSTLERIGRGHSFADTAEAVRRLHSKDIPVGLHLILGLPGERREDYIRHAKTVSGLDITSIKLHQLQIIRGTRLAEEFARNPGIVEHFSAEEYADTVALFIRTCRPDIAFDRFVSEVPPQMLISPKWGVKADRITEMVRRRLLLHRGTEC